MRTKRIQISRLTTEDGYDVWNKMMENHIIPTLIAFDNVELVSNNKIKASGDTEKVDQLLFKVNGMEGTLLYMHMYTNNNMIGNGDFTFYYGLSNGLNLPDKSRTQAPTPRIDVSSVNNTNLDVTMITFSRNNKLYAVGFKLTNSNIAYFVVFTITKSGTKYATVLGDKLYIDGGAGSTLAEVGIISDFDLQFTTENKVLMMPAMSKINNILGEELPELFLISNNSFNGIIDNQQLIINGEKYRKTGSRGSIDHRILFLSEGEE